MSFQGKEMSMRIRSFCVLRVGILSCLVTLSQAAQAAEIEWGVIGASGGNQPVPVTTMVVVCPDCDPWPEDPDEAGGTNRAHPRHAGQSNYCVVDGHVESQAYPELRANDRDLFGHTSY